MAFSYEDAPILTGHVRGGNVEAEAILEQLQWSRSLSDQRDIHAMLRSRYPVFLLIKPLSYLRD